MSAVGLGAGQRQDVAEGSRRCRCVPSQRLIKSGRRGESSKLADFSVAELAGIQRVSLMLAPRARGSLRAQLADVLSCQDEILQGLATPHVVTSQTVFLRTPADQAECAGLLAEHYGPNQPVTTFVLQPPCCGAALAIEAWALSGRSIRIKRFARNLMAVEYDGLRWVYCGAIEPARPDGLAHDQTVDALGRLRTALTRAACGFDSVVRTWFYLGGITARERRTQRYKELNRARSNFYQPIRFYPSLLRAQTNRGVYPASTGIGMAGTGLMIGCTALQTQRDDVFLVTLENPQQTPAYEYHSKYSPQSPKFSRALALVTPGYAMTWISGTASIVNSESQHPGDIEKQTEQTINNIQKLIAPDNFRACGAPGFGASLEEMAKLRVYIKRHEDYAKCRAVCERRFGAVPTIYAVADVCRPELLVEIEGLAVCPRLTTGQAKGNGRVSAAVLGK